jgi:hypothetical protein
MYKLLCLNPRDSTARKGLIRAVDETAWAIDVNFVPVLVFVVRFDAEHWAFAAVLLVRSQVVLVHMNPFEHS